MLCAIAAVIVAQTRFDPSLTQCLQWRCIGPFRGGRTVGACGIPNQPNTFFIGVNNGGVWKTTDAGRTWIPIFDDQPTGSVGDVALCESQPNVLYVGSGEGLQRPDLSTGNGMYKSINGGKTWEHLGLDDAQQIAGLAVDPNDPNRVFVAALGHPYGPNDTRGVFRTLDGGKSWGRVLFVDENTGATQVTIDPNDGNLVYADLWQARQGPWENGQWQGPGSGLYKSLDGGDHWKQLTKGLPTTAQGLGRIGFAIAPSNSKVMYATVDSGQMSGIYRSDDSGESWTLVNKERRLVSRGSDFAEIKVDPKNPEIVYTCDTSTYRSVDGGKNWTCIKGSPGGDDYHRLWINPLHPEILLLAADQGAAISVNGGETWSSWYNQPTAQFYHVITDNLFPYNVYGGQQESGSAGVQSRGNDGQITFREWHPVGADEYAYVAPDPLNPNIVYGGKGTRYHKDTGEVENIGPDRQKLGLRFLRTSPLLFSPTDPRTLYMASQVLLKTRDGGRNWEVISPDLSREHPDVPDSVGVYKTDALKTMPRRGVIYTVAPSPVDGKVIWCGTDDGLIWITRDGGKQWSNVTPPQVTSWSKVSIMDAGHFDSATAYAAVNRIRLDDQKPHILRTHDGGKTWVEIVGGLPDGPINTVKEDPKLKGLLFCGSEQAVYFSPDDGASWHSLRNNMPATSIRDLVVHGDDVVVGTHGRSFWILDNFSLIRELSGLYVQISGRSEAAYAGFVNHLFQPATAYLLDRNTNSDTPLPPEEPAGKNPPDGAVIDYHLVQTIKAPSVRLDILDAKGKQVRSFSSEDPVQQVDPKLLTVMQEWVRPQAILPTNAGSNRFVWDLRMAPPKTTESGRGGGVGLPISAIWHDTPAGPQGERVEPGIYTIRLNVNGMKFERQLTVKPDPRRGRR